MRFFLIDNPLTFTPTYVMKLQAILEKLNEMYVANSKWATLAHYLIPSSSPHKFHENFLRLCKDS